MFCSSGTISSLKCHVIPNIKTFVNCVLGVKESANPKFESAFYTNLHNGACDGTTPTMEF
jgi:hypothetical protein